MKRISLLLFLSLALLAGLQAQVVVVYGYVTANGVGVNNYPVTITGAGPISYTNTVMTGSNGYYSDSVTVNTTQGSFTASLVDCHGNIQADSGFFSPPNYSMPALNLDACPRTGGGGCQAAFTYTNTGGALNVFQFTDQSSSGNPGSPISSWSWDFGDGGTSTAQNPVHTYTSSANSFTICLIVSDMSGCSDTTCQTVSIVSPNPCSAAFGYQRGSGNQVSFFNNSSGGIPPYVVSWNFGDGNTAFGSNPSHTYASAGTYTVCMVITDGGGCVDSTCQLVTLSSNPSCSANFSFQPSGLGVQFIDRSQGVSVFATNSYSWNFGDGGTSNVQNPSHTYAASGTYTVCLYFTSVGGGVTCTDTMCQVITLTNTTNNGVILGQVFKANSGADSVMVWLIEHDATAGTLTAIDSTITHGTPISGAGFYTFSNLPAGNYRTKAALIPGDADYANYLPTYHDNDLMWNNATVIGLAANGTATANINLVAGNNPGGPGFIGGLISQGANKRDPGDPLENVYVYLLDNNDAAVAYTQTDAQGEYGFSNLAYGTYRVHVEILGKNYTDQYITLSSASSAVTNVNYAVNSTDVEVTTALELPTFGRVMKLYPNPTSGELYIELSLDQAIELEIQLIDMLGRSQLSQQNQLAAGDQKLQLNLNNLSRGVYFLNLKADNQIISQKVVVE